MNMNIIKWGAILLFSGFLLPACSGHHTVNSSDLQIIRSHFLHEIFETVPQDQKSTWIIKESKEWMERQAPDGSFTDIDYLDTNNGSWGPHNSISRAMYLIMATQMPENPLYHNAEAEAAALKAIHFIAAGSWWHFNWWTLEIGYPLTTYKLLLLEDSKLDPLSRDYLMSATRMGHLTEHPSNWPANGQNLVWFSEITIALGVLYEREDWIHLAVDALSKELQIGGSQGIQEDLSFFQHGKLFYSGGYGLNFSKDTVRMFKLLGGTSLQFNQKNYDTLSSYILDGQLWLIHGNSLDPSSIGRTYVRTGGDRANQLLPACHEMAKVPGTRQREFAECEANLIAGKNGKNGNRYFWKGDYLTHNKSQENSSFGISVRMNSTRTLNADATPLGEGLKSHHMAEGLTFIHRTGEEYNAIFPILDFNRLPGVTNEYQAKYPEVLNGNYEPHFGETDFVGAVSDGQSGAAVLDFKSGKLSAKKSWFFFDQGMVALGAQIHCAGCMPVYTSINQEWSKTPIQYSSKGLIKSLEEGQIKNQDLDWAFANGTGYLMLSKNELTLQNKEQSGSLKSIALQLSPALIKGKITSLWINQKKAQASDSYAYAVLPNTSVEELKKDTLTPPFEIISNTAEVQSVYFPEEKNLEMIFYRAGKLVLKKADAWVSVDQPAALQIKITGTKVTLTASSPNQKVSELNVEWHNLAGQDGARKISMPTDSQAGNSVSVLVGD